MLLIYFAFPFIVRISIYSSLDFEFGSDLASIIFSIILPCVSAQSVQPDDDLSIIRLQHVL